MLGPKPAAPNANAIPFFVGEGGGGGRHAQTTQNESLGAHRFIKVHGQGKEVGRAYAARKFHLLAPFGTFWRLKDTQK